MTDNIVDVVQDEERFTENPDGAKEGDPLLEFFDITLTGYGDDSTVGVFHLFDGLEDTNPVDSIQFNGKDYLGIPISISGIEATSAGAQPRPTLSVANIPVLSRNRDAQEAVLDDIRDGTITNLDLPFNTNQDLIGSKVVYRQAYLSQCNQAGTPEEFPRATFFIDRVASETQLIVTFELASPLDMEGAKIPNRYVIGQYCPWQYQGRDLLLGGGCTWRYKESEQHSFFRRDDTKITGTINTWNSSTNYTAKTSSQPASIVKTTHGTTGQVQIWEALFDNRNKDPDTQRRYWKRIDLCGKTLNSCKIRFQGKTIDISSITKGTATFIECSTNHGLAMQDIVKINLPLGTDLATLLNGTHRVTTDGGTDFTIAVNSLAANANFTTGYISQIDTNVPLPFGGFPGSKKFR